MGIFLLTERTLPREPIPFLSGRLRSSRMTSNPSCIQTIQSLRKPCGGSNLKRCFLGLREDVPDNPDVEGVVLDE